MRLLLDTCALIWWQANHPRIAPQIGLIQRTPQVHVSVISMVEMTVKIGLGKLRLDLDTAYDALRADRFTLLPIEQRHLTQQLELSEHHRDPFDRLIIAQAKTEELTILTADKRFEAYGVDSIMMR